MSVMSDYDLQLQEVAQAMSDQSPDTQLEYRLDRIVSDLDELCGIANSAPNDLDRHLTAIGQIITRAQLIGSLVMSRKPQFKVIGRG